MKRFNARKYNKRKINYVFLILLLIIIFDYIFLGYYTKNLSKNVVNIVKIKLEELNRYYLNNTIKKFLNINTNDYIKLNFVNNNIVNVDIDQENSNKLLKLIIEDLTNNIKNITKGDINDYFNLELLKGNNGVVLYVPTGVIFNNAILANLGPKIPIKSSFLNNLEANVDVEVSNYGINNSLIKLYININIKEIIEMPTESDTSTISYKYLLASKLVNGQVPNFIGTNFDKSSEIVNSNVN